MTQWSIKYICDGVLCGNDFQFAPCQTNFCPRQQSFKNSIIQTTFLLKNDSSTTEKRLTANKFKHNFSELEKNYYHFLEIRM